jgi:hypothetical protein
MIDGKQFFHRPDMVSDASSHSGRALDSLGVGSCLDFQAGVRAAEVEMGNGQRNRVSQILQFLGKARRQAGKSLIEMAQRQVQPLRMARGNVPAVGIASNANRLAANALAIEIAALPIGGAVAVILFDLDGVIHFCSFVVVQDPANKPAPAVACELESIRNASAQVGDKVFPARIFALAGQVRENELGFLARRKVGVKVSGSRRVALGSLVINQRPAFVNFDRFRFKLPQLFIHKFRAMLNRNRCGVSTFPKPTAS